MTDYVSFGDNQFVKPYSDTNVMFKPGDEFDIVGSGVYELIDIHPSGDTLRFKRDRERGACTGELEKTMTLREFTSQLNDSVRYLNDGPMTGFR